MDPAQLVSLIASLNPDNVPGRLAMIVRMGADKLRQKFPALIEAVEQAGQVGHVDQLAMDVLVLNGLVAGFGS